MSKKLFLTVIGVLVLFITLTPVTGSWAQDRIQVTVDGDPLLFDQPPVMIYGSVMVPMRGVFERLGAKVKWDGPTRTITANRGDTEIILPLGGTRASVNGEGRTLATPALSIGGRTMVPLRFVSEALNANVQWVAITRTVVITSGQQGQPAPVPSTPTPAPPPTTTAPPRIDSVTHNATAPLHPGDTIVVTIRGEPGAQGSFDIFSVAQNVSMREVSPGTYEGSFIIPAAAQNVSNLAVFGRLTRDGKQNMMGASAGVSIFAQAVSIEKILPEENSTVTTNRPNILVIFKSSGNIKVLPESISLLVNGQNVTQQASKNEDVVSYLPQTNLNAGSNLVFISFRDSAGNSIQKQWSFNIQTGGTIQSVTHDAARTLSAGDVLTVTMIGAAGGTAVFDIGNYRLNNPMTQVASGKYQGTYLVKTGDNISGAFVIGRLTMPGQSPVVLSSSTTVSLGASVNPTLEIISPRPDQAVSDDFEIVGKTSPLAQVDLSVKISISGFLNLEKELITTQVQASETGEFRYQFKGFMPFGGGDYIIRAVARNAAGLESQPVTVKVPRS
ncbi:MAG: copper amine oxidase N-terminal domain-containing protein [Chloroflexi bacterium]|nr:copper amine oxidase N-terminal domain-containing protein [Chloroflexota bacterium]